MRPLVRSVALLLALAAPLGAWPTATTVDDRYRFVPGASEEVPVALERTALGVRLKWTPPHTAGWDTALLAVRCVGTGPEAGSAGSASDSEAGSEAGSGAGASTTAHPAGDSWVALLAGSQRVEQHLEPGARGLRWLDIGALRDQLATATTVELVTSGVTLEPGPTSVRVFANRLDLTGTILVLAPHPDDAEIAAFGLYADSNATIVTVTAGNAGDFSYRANVPDRSEHFRFKGFLRAVDSVTVPWQGGIPPERCFNLGYFDAQLEAMHKKPSEPVHEAYVHNQDVLPYRRANLSHLMPIVSRTATWNHLVEDLEQVFERVHPSIVVMPHPFLDMHRDHQLVTVAAVQALAHWHQPAKFLLYTNHAWGNEYPFGPAGTLVSLPPWTRMDLPVESVYTHPVSPELQRRKLFALESMHDLRLTPEEQLDYAGHPGNAARGEPREGLLTYYRRGPRADELFFVHGRESLRKLVDAYLGAHGWR